MVGKHIGTLLIGKHHLVDSIGRGGGVLQQVGSIVPATAHIDVLAFLGGMILDVGILGVAAVALKRIVATPLLAHVIQHKVGRAVIDVAAYGHLRRGSLACLDVVIARSAEAGKIQAES